MATYTSQKHLDRRSFLKAAGISLALPWLDSMVPAFGAAPKPPMRFVGVVNYLSFHTPHLFPKQAGRDYEVTPYLQILQPLRDDFTVISGLNHPQVRDSHASEKSFFTGAPNPSSPSFRNTISLDQVAAETLGRETRYPSLQLSSNGSGSSLSFSRNGVNLPAEGAPERAFAKLFIDGTKTAISEEIARIHEGRSILDKLTERSKQLQREVGARDREKLDQYFTGVRELEQRLERSEAYAREPKPKPGVPPIKAPLQGEDTARLGAHLEVARLALQADLTRFVTVHFRGTVKTPSHPGINYSHHDLSHHGQSSDKIEQLAVLETDVLREWSGFLKRMKDCREGDATLLGRTMTVLGAGMGNASSHDSTNLPILLAGGRFRHGQHLAFDPLNPPPLCNLWVQVLQELGLEVNRFGSSTAASLPGILS